MKHDSAAFCVPSESITYHLLRYDSKKDIYYYEGNWWMSGDTYRELDYGRFQEEYGSKQVWLGKYKRMNNGVKRVPRPNKETREIELDVFVLPRL